MEQKEIKNEQQNEATQEQQKQTITVKVGEIYDQWTKKCPLHPDVKNMLARNLGGSPFIGEKEVESLVTISPISIYLAYLETWAENNHKSYVFRSPSVGEEVYAEEENACGNYALLRKDEDGKYEITSPYADAVPAIVVKLLITVLATEAEKQNIDKTLSELSKNWKMSPEKWSYPGDPTNNHLLGLSATLGEVFKRAKDTEMELYKAQTDEDVTLDFVCDATLGISGGLRTALTAEEFANADRKVAERISPRPPKADPRTAMTAIHLMSEFEMLEDDKYLVPSFNEPRYKNGYEFEEWEYEGIRGVVEGRYKNILLYGPPGTGKSTWGRTLALVTGLPHRPPFSCDPNTNKHDLIGSWQMNKNGVPEFMLSSIMQAVRYGGVVELQEVSRIRDSNALALLNNVLESVGYIQIPQTGEYFKRHKNCIIILTTNLGQPGCHNVDQSVLSRMNYKRFVEPLSKEELIKRALNEPEVFMDTDFLIRMADVWMELCDVFANEGLYGDDSYRTFLDWAKDTCATGDPIKSADNVVIDIMAFNTDTDSKKILRAPIKHYLQGDKPKIDKSKQNKTYKKELDALATLVRRKVAAE